MVQCRETILKTHKVKHFDSLTCCAHFFILYNFVVEILSFQQCMNTRFLYKVQSGILIPMTNGGELIDFRFSSLFS